MLLSVLALQCLPYNAYATLGTVIHLMVDTLLPMLLSVHESRHLM